MSLAQSNYIKRLPLVLFDVLFSLTDEPEWPAEQRGEFFGFISGKTNLTCEANAEPPAQVLNSDSSIILVTFDAIR